MRTREDRTDRLMRWYLRTMERLIREEQWREIDTVYNWTYLRLGRSRHRDAIVEVYYYACRSR
jgi:hypothetical protein